MDAILEMEAPKDQSELRRFLGMVNHLSKFQPQIVELSKPLRDLLSSKNHWSWSSAQQHAFSALKRSLTSTPTLAHYDARRETTLSTDASSYGLGAVLRQKQDDDQWRPVAYASRAMTPTEQRYAQIEKEALGITWASERFADYLIGLQFHIETDQTVGAIAEYQEPGGSPSQGTEVQNANDAIQLHDLACTWKTLVHRRHAVARTPC